MPAPKRGARITEKEGEFIHTYYNARGARWVAEQLRRPTKSIKQYAHRHGIGGRQLPNAALKKRMTLAEASEVTKLSISAVYKRAINDGVLMRHGGTPRRPAISSVPNAWVKEQRREREGIQENPDELRRAGWLSVDEAAKYIGVNASGMRATFIRQGNTNPPIRNVMCRNSHGNPTRFLHPQDVEAYRAQLEKEARQAETMVSLKSITIELQVSITGVRKIARRLGFELVRLRRKRTPAMLFISPEGAEAVKAHYEAFWKAPTNGWGRK